MKQQLVKKKKAANVYQCLSLQNKVTLFKVAKYQIRISRISKKTKKFLSYLTYNMLPPSFTLLW